MVLALSLNHLMLAPTKAMKTIVEVMLEQVVIIVVTRLESNNEYL
jgi:hypothetical protein